MTTPSGRDGGRRRMVVSFDDDPPPAAAPPTGRRRIDVDDVPPRSDPSSAGSGPLHRAARLTWSGQPVELGRRPVVLGLSAHGRVVAPPDEPAVPLAEISFLGGRYGARTPQPNAECRLRGVPLGVEPQALEPGDVLEVAGEAFRFDAQVAARRPSIRVTPDPGAPIELRLTVVDRRGDDHDLQLLAQADDRVDRTFQGVARALGLGPVEGAVVERTGALLAPDDRLGSADLRWGDRVRIARATGPVPPPRPAGQQWDGPRLSINRAPRVLRPAPTTTVDLPAPPDDPSAPRFPLALSLIPLVAGIAMALVVGNPLFLLFALLTPVMAAASYFGDRRQGSERYAERAARFRWELDAANTRLTQTYIAEGQHRVAQSPGLDVLVPRATTHRTALWERRPTDPDFLHLRVGTGSLPFASRVSYQHGGSDLLRHEARSLLDRFALLRNVPVTVPLPDVGVCGIPGPPQATAAIVRTLVVQATLLHSPADLVVVAATGHAAGDAWRWLTWLPHVAAAGDVLGGAPLARGDIPARALLDRVQRLQEERLASDRGAGRQVRHLPHVLLVVDGALALDGPTVRGIVAAARESGVSLLWTAAHQHDLPLATGAILSLTSATTLDLIRADGGDVVPGIVAEPLGVPAAEATARDLAPLLDRGARGRETGVPSRVGLLDLLGLQDPDPDRIAHQWSRRRDDLSAPVGAGASGPFEIDLRRDGPHALVVGTTGSGKSELLRSVVCALAARHPPTVVTFLLFDYKGGAAFGPCAGLPHVVDVVSDLDEHLSRRALVALDAELLRREKILARFGAKDLFELAEKAPGHTPPSLVLAVDEFAKLRDEVPEFVDGVVDVAQRGRSLGVHMILASQTLGNAFTAPIKANTNLRLALRAADESQSVDAVGTSDAAHIPSGPEHSGRGFARTGLGRPLEFQSAYVSGVSAAGTTAVLTVAPFDLAGAMPATGVASSADAGGTTDLERLVEAVVDATTDLGLTPPPPPWLPPLADALPASRLPRPAGGRDALAIGLLDEPRLQRQGPLTLDPDQHGFTVVYGAGGSGRSSALRTIAGQVAAAFPPDEAQVYAIDPAGRGLASLVRLPHCGAVVTAADRERLERLLDHLAAEVEDRARSFGAAGVTSLQGYRERRPDDPRARVLLLVDDLDELLRAIDNAAGAALTDRLLQIVASGRPVGVSVVATAASRSGVGSTFQPLIDQRLVLRMTSPDDAMSVGVDPDAARGMRGVAGRAVVGSTLEAQLAHVGATPDGDDQVAGLEELGARAAARWPGLRAPAIGRLPDRVERRDLPAPHGLRSLPVGIGGVRLQPLAVDLSDGHLLVSGPRRSGRSGVLVALAAALGALPAPGVQLGVIAPRRSPLRTIPHSGPRPEDLAGMTDLMVEAALVVDERSRDGAHQPVVLLVDDAGDLDDARFSAAAEKVARLGPDVGVHLVVAADRSTARGFTHPWVRKIASDGLGIVLQPEDASQAEHLGAELPRHDATPSRPGRGYLVRDGGVQVVQVAAGADPEATVA
ncbi:FtsK/SpoIIIE domain-containing protein [Patulibacter sp. NPDC049589]|uniref:FtsK/SpoIIIE domain-containing protein n=1 Tax=Patulibacter sp. NPDC049589 TaxID=3154731 RepID=UPI0034463AC2